MSAVVLFSGGLDSTVAVAQAVRDGHKTIKLLRCIYGSMHNNAEMVATTKLLIAFSDLWEDVTWIVPSPVELPPIFSGGGSSLMGDVPIPTGEYVDAEVTGPTNTEVPFRNANLISVATTIAMRDGHDSVYIGVHASDHNRWAYPDCSPEFIGAMENAVYVGSMHRVRLIAPFIWSTKAGVVEYGMKYNAPLHLTWSCYRGGGVHCGECPTCIERHQAFLEGMGWDPTNYLVDPETHGREL